MLMKFLARRVVRAVAGTTSKQFEECEWTKGSLDSVASDITTTHVQESSSKLVT